MRNAFMTLLVTLLSSAGLLAQQALDSSSITDKLVGTWKLVSVEATTVDGKTGPDPRFGAHGVGYLIYDRSGHMCAHIMNPDRLKWKDENRPTEQEKSLAMDGFLAYCGKYEVNEAAHVIIHRPEVAWSPNYVGTVQRRPYRFDGNRLVLAPKNVRTSITEVTLTWERVR